MTRMHLFKAVALAALISACAGNSVPDIFAFQAAPDTIEAGSTSTLVVNVTNGERITVDQGVGEVFSPAIVTVQPLVTTTYTLTARSHDGKVVSATATVTVLPVHAASFTVTVPAATAGTAVTATLTALDAKGNTSATYAGTAKLTSDDAQAVLPAPVAFTAGKAFASVTFKTSGAHVLTATDSITATTTGSGKVTVKNAAAASLALGALPAAAHAGDAIAVQVKALDAYGNLAADYTGTVTVTATDAAATVGAAAAFTAADAGAKTFGASFATTGSWTLTATGGTLHVTSAAIAVSNAPAVRVSLSGVPAPATAGTAASITATLQDRYGNTATDYAGTLHFANTDAAAPAIANLTLAAADHGTKAASVTFNTAGAQTLSVQDTVKATIAGSAALSVIAGAPASCTVSATPAAARAGDALPMRVTVWDAHANVAPSYTGTVSFSSGDSRASLPAATAYAAGDQGVHDFSAKLGTPGPQTLTASGTGLGATCAASVTISAGHASQFAVSGLPSLAIAGTAVGYTVTAKDSYGNVATDYAGPFTSGSTDSKASIVETGSGFASGVESFTVSFGSIGGQTVNLTDNTAGFAGSGGPVGVHGLVYTNPDVTTQSMVLTVNAAASNAGSVVLNLSAAAPAVGYSIGFNVPADSSRAALTSIVKGVALNPGSAPAAIAASLPGTGPLANTLTAGLSQKAAGTGAVTTDTGITASQVIYTLTLKPISTSPGVVFDGANAFRAALRDKAGNEVLSQDAFAIGKLEVQ